VRERKGKKRKVWGRGWGVAYLDEKSVVISREEYEDIWRSLPSSALSTVTQHRHTRCKPVIEGHRVAREGGWTRVRA
jgi:hypothetical protein